MSSFVPYPAGLYIQLDRRFVISITTTLLGKRVVPLFYIYLRIHFREFRQWLLHTRWRYTTGTLFEREAKRGNAQSNVLDCRPPLLLRTIDLCASQTQVRGEFAPPLDGLGRSRYYPTTSAEDLVLSSERDPRLCTRQCSRTSCTHAAGLIRVFHTSIMHH